MADIKKDQTALFYDAIKKVPQEQIVTTKATADLCSIMLRDCAHIQMQEAEWKNRKGKRSGDGKLFKRTR